MQLTDEKRIAALHSYLQGNFPSLAAQKIRFEEETDDYLVMSAPLDCNHNDLHTAFGGSLYNLALVSCWSTLFLACQQHMDAPRIVTRDAQMRYRHPVEDAMVRASCRKPNARQWDGFFAHYEKAGRTSITLTSNISIAAGTAAYFDGVFVLLENS